MSTLELSPSPALRWRRWAALPLWRLLLAGALLLALDKAATRFGGWNRPPLVLSASEQQRRIDAWTLMHGVAPSPAVEQQLIEEAIEEEVLYREALRRGLDQNNPMIRNRLISLMRQLGADDEGRAAPEALLAEAEKLDLGRRDFAVRRHLVLQMRLLAGLPARDTPVTDAELAALLQGHAAQFQRPARWTLQQRYFSRRHYGEAARARAATALADPASRAGDDPWPGGEHLQSVDAQALDAQFGPGATAAIAALPLQQWSGPFESPYGWHLLRVENVQPASLPAVAEVRGRLIELWRRERSLARTAEVLPQLKARYEIRVEDRRGHAERGLRGLPPSPDETAGSLD